MLIKCQLNEKMNLLAVHSKLSMQSCSSNLHKNNFPKIRIFRNLTSSSSSKIYFSKVQKFQSTTNECFLT